MEVRTSQKRCLREPVPEIMEAARLLDAAVSCHQRNKRELAEELFATANMPEIREWTESIWGSQSKYVVIRTTENSPPLIPEKDRIPVRMPNKVEKQSLIARDGYHCRFCGIPVIRPEVRKYLVKIYPEAISWARKNIEQHAAFQAMWLQYDHLLPHARGGDNSIENIVITCAPCNFGRMEYPIEDVGLRNPFDRAPVVSLWDGLERVLNK